ncbi:MAG: hypothetical protein ACJAT2_003875 [Bacteriovoracaceae bacterium]|jgi:hypothetical protein
MPIYLYKHPNKDQYVEIVQTMSEDHVHFDDDGLEWKREWFSPQLNTEGSIDPFNNVAFIDKTGKMKGTHGDMMDYSKEMSEKRKSITGGKDPVQEAYYKKYSSTRKGSVHPDQKKKSYESKNVKVDYD